MNKLIDKLMLSDNAGFHAVPEWARFYFDIGYQIGQMQMHHDKFLRLVIVTPISDYVATFIAFGKLISQTTAPFDFKEHIDTLLQCPDETRFVRIFNNKLPWKKQRVFKTLSRDGNYISFKYYTKSEPITSKFLLDSPELLNIMRIHVVDEAEHNHKMSIDDFTDVIVHPAFAAHYSRLINPERPYSAIVGAMTQQRAELEIKCQYDALEFRLDNLITTKYTKLLQPNTLLLSGQTRSEIETIKSDLVIFTGGSGIVNHAYTVNNKHHVYVLDYQDSSLGDALALVQTQYFNRCDYQPEIQNTRLFKPVETTAFFVWG